MPSNSTYTSLATTVWNQFSCKDQEREDEEAEQQDIMSSFLCHSYQVKRSSGCRGPSSKYDHHSTNSHRHHGDYSVTSSMIPAVLPRGRRATKGNSPLRRRHRRCRSNGRGPSFCSSSNGSTTPSNSSEAKFVFPAPQWAD